MDRNLFSQGLYYQCTTAQHTQNVEGEHKAENNPITIGLHHEPWVGESSHTIFAQRYILWRRLAKNCMILNNTLAVRRPVWCEIWELEFWKCSPGEYLSFLLQTLQRSLHIYSMHCKQPLSLNLRNIPNFPREYGKDIAKFLQHPNTQHPRPPPQRHLVVGCCFFAQSCSSLAGWDNQPRPRLPFQATIPHHSHFICVA